MYGFTYFRFSKSQSHGHLSPKQRNLCHAALTQTQRHALTYHHTLINIAWGLLIICFACLAWRRVTGKGPWELQWNAWPAVNRVCVFTWRLLSVHLGFIIFTFCIGVLNITCYFLLKKKNSLTLVKMLWYLSDNFHSWDYKMQQRCRTSHVHLTKIYHKAGCCYMFRCSYWSAAEYFCNTRLYN